MPNGRLGSNLIKSRNVSYKRMHYKCCLLKGGHFSQPWCLKGWNLSFSKLLTYSFSTATAKAIYFCCVAEPPISLPFEGEWLGLIEIPFDFRQSHTSYMFQRISGQNIKMFIHKFWFQDATRLIKSSLYVNTNSIWMFNTKCSQSKWRFLPKML